MGYSQTIVSVIVMLLAELLPKIGVTVGSDALTTTISTLVVVGSGVWIWVRRVKWGDVGVLGKRK